MQYLGIKQLYRNASYISRPLLFICNVSYTGFPCAGTPRSLKSPRQNIPRENLFEKKLDPVSVY